MGDLATEDPQPARGLFPDRKSTRLNSSHLGISYAVFCLKKKTSRQDDGDDLEQDASEADPDRDVRGALVGPGEVEDLHAAEADERGPAWCILHESRSTPA